MKVAVVQSVDTKWEVKDVLTPEPSANQVLIKVHANRLYHTDAFITKGKHRAATATTFPCVSSLTEASRYSQGAKNNKE